jgi:protein-tyrosine phosphatase
MKKVLFVCLGNICRSPSAHGIFETLVAQADADSWIEVDSAGTAAYHIGKSPDPRSVQAAKKRGYDLSHLRARQVTEEDFDTFDFILAMDRENLANLQTMRPEGSKAKVRLFLEYGQCVEQEVPDPYYGGDAGFEHVLDLVENASTGLLMSLERQKPL